jgi:LysR family transcriptional regulator, nod-box dependent transcriptional activator
MTDSAEKQVNFRRYDLNLLPFFRALLLTHSVARSSEMLGVSQSAVSGALRRLRGTFGDQLFIQVGRGLVPTPKALYLQSLLDESFDALARLFEEREFQPHSEERCFVVCTSDYITSQIAVPLLKTLTTQAPLCSLRFLEMSKAEQRELELGNIDVQISPRAGPYPAPEMLSIPLYEDEQVILAPKSLNVPNGVLDLDFYLEKDHASFFVHGADSLETHALRALNLAQRTIIYVPEHNQLPAIVKECGCLAMVPRTAAEKFASEFDLKVWPVPFEIPKYRQSLYWSPILDQDPAHRWFRHLVADVWNSIVKPTDRCTSAEKD